MLERFLDVSDRMAFTASLHLEQMPDVRPFFDKAQWFQSAKPAATKFVVTTVAIEAEFPRLKVLAGKFSDAGIAFEVAPRKCGSKFLQYNDPAFIEFMNSHALAHIEDIRGLRLLGSLCHTGSLFARINLHGDGLRCYNMQPRFPVSWAPCIAGRACICSFPPWRRCRWTAAGQNWYWSGDGPELENLRRQAGALRLSDDVHFSGRVAWQDTPACIAGFDIGYSGQIATETGDWYGSPIKIYEFLAMGKPVIASAFEDARRVIVDGRTGYLFSPGDLSALRECLQTAFRQKEKWPEMGWLARDEF